MDLMDFLVLNYDCIRYYLLVIIGSLTFGNILKLTYNQNVIYLPRCQVTQVSENLYTNQLFYET